MQIETKGEEDEIETFRERFYGKDLFTVLSGYLRAVVSSPSAFTLDFALILISIYRYLSEVHVHEEQLDEALLIAELLFEQLLEQMTLENLQELQTELTSLLLRIEDLVYSTRSYDPLLLTRVAWLKGNYEEHLGHFQAALDYFSQCANALARVTNTVKLPHLRCAYPGIC